jgi:hypothetical protein
MALVAVKGANKNYALSIRIDTVISECRSAILTKKISTHQKEGITVHAESLYQETTYCKLRESFDCGSKILNFTTVRVTFLNITLVPIYPRNF